MSIVKWFRSSRGEAERLIDDGLIINDKKGSCRLAVNAADIEIIPHDPYDELDASS